MRKEKRVVETLSILDAIDAARFEAEALHDEMQEWASNLEERFSTTDKYSRVSETADALDSVVSDLETIQVPGAAETRPVEIVTFTPYGRRGPSRATRASNASNYLSAAASGLSAWIEEMRARQDLTEDETDALDEAESVVGEIEAQADELGGLDFPGMYG